MFLEISPLKRGLHYVAKSGSCKRHGNVLLRKNVPSVTTGPEQSKNQEDRCLLARVMGGRAWEDPLGHSYAGYGGL